MKPSSLLPFISIAAAVPAVRISMSQIDITPNTHVLHGDGDVHATCSPEGGYCNLPIQYCCDPYVCLQLPIVGGACIKHGN